MRGVCSIGDGGGVTSPLRGRKDVKTDVFLDSEFVVVLCWIVLEADGRAVHFFVKFEGREGGGKL